MFEHVISGCQKNQDILNARSVRVTAKHKDIGEVLSFVVHPIFIAISQMVVYTRNVYSNH